MRLLVDENLSFRLPALLAEDFPGSLHVRDIGLKGGIDNDIWEYAKANHLCILTKDLDFQVKSLVSDSPAKVILVRLGNCSTARVQIAVLNSREAIEALGTDPAVSMLVIP